MSVFLIFSILHVRVVDWGSDYVLKGAKEFDPLPLLRGDTPPLRGEGAVGIFSRECCILVHYAWFVGQ